MGRRRSVDVPRHSPRKPPWWPLWLGLGLVLLPTAVIVVGWSIGSAVRDISDEALRDHPGDRIKALVALVESDDHPIRERNRAIWALGQLGDPRALPALERHYTGLTGTEGGGLSRYELAKAIRLCRGARNLPALMWRRGALVTK